MTLSATIYNSSCDVKCRGLVKGPDAENGTEFQQVNRTPKNTISTIVKCMYALNDRERTDWPKKTIFGRKLKVKTYKFVVVF